MVAALSTLASGVTSDTVFRSTFNEIVAHVQNRRTYKYAVHSTETTESLMDAPVGLFAAGDIVEVNWYDSNKDPRSGGKLYVSSVRGAPYVGTLATLANGGSSGLILEGTNYRFAIVPADGGVIDMRRAGIRCVDGVTGWHSRMTVLNDFAKNQIQNVVITGTGVLTCTETVTLDRMRCKRLPLFKASSNFFDRRVNVTNTAERANLLATIAPGTPVVITAAGHNFANNQQVMFGSTKKLGGSLKFFTTYFVRNSNPGAGTFEVSLTSGGASISNATAGAGTHYVFYAVNQTTLPSKTGVTTLDWIRWDGKVERTGIVLRAGLNGDNIDFMEQAIEVRGDGDLNTTTKVWTTIPTVTCIRHENDDSANAEYRYSVNGGYVGVAVSGPAEKHRLSIHATECVWETGLPFGASADTLEISLYGNDCQGHYMDWEGSDTSPVLNIHVEGRADPVLDTSGFSEGADMPAILCRTGKGVSFGGVLRANNGRRNIVITGGTSADGSSNRFGADFVQFLGLRILHGYGSAVEIWAAASVSGTVDVKDWDDAYQNAASYPSGPSELACPAFILGRIGSAAGLYVTGAKIKNSIGLLVGYDNSTSNPVANGPHADGIYYYSKEAHLGHWAIDMGTLLQFNSSSGAELSGASAHPTTLLAVQIAKWNNCMIDLEGTRGNIQLDAACVGGKFRLDPVLAPLFTTTNSSTGAVAI